MATNTVDPPDSWRWWPWVVWTVVGLLLAGSVRVQYTQSRAPAGGPDDQVVADLAARLKRDWSDEAVRREVTRPAPLLVSWSSTGRPAASRETVLGDPSVGDWVHLPLRGQTDALNEQIVAAFRGLPRRQLLVLGEPGAGKSVFGLLLTLGLIRTRTLGEPVPVLLAINVWDPAEPVDVFAARRLAEDYADVLAVYGDPRSVADRLVEHQHVLPVLDGLDELPAAAIGAAVKALDAYAVAGRPVVVTCRIREYEQAVARSEIILTTAAVVELEPVTSTAAIAFLSYPERARARWEPVFAHLRQQSDGDDPGGRSSSSPLMQAFATPLMVALARTAYQDPGTDPAELLEAPSRQAVTGRLMDAFVTAVYTAPQPIRSTGQPRPRRTYRADPARQWLTCLAYHLHHTGTRDLHWWQITPDLLTARPQRAKVMTVAAAAATAGLIAGLAGTAAGVNTISSTLAGIVIVIVAAGGWLRPMWPHGYPTYIRVRFRTRPWRRIEQFGLPLSYGSIGGLLTGLITADWTATLPAGLIYALTAVLLPSWRPAVPARRATPTTTLSHNRRTVAAATTQHALTSGAVFTLAAILTHTPPVASGTTAGLIYGTTAGLVAGGWTWTRFRLTHARLALQGWLPWRLHAFLADAHHHGVLRQAGTIYQYRHAILQDHLAQALHPHQLQARANAGDRHAARQLAELLVKQGRVDEAIRIWQARADAGDRLATKWLIELLAGQGRVEDLRAWADAGNEYAARQLAELLAGQVRVEEAMQILHALAAAGNYPAAYRLAELLAGQGRVEEAIQILRPWADADTGSAAERLAELLAGQGHVEEAIQILQARADGDLVAAKGLVELLAGQGRVEELRARADAGHEFAADRLAELLAGQGRVEELQAWADAGNKYAARQLAELLAGQGHVEEAIQILHALAAGNYPAAYRLAELLAGQGRVEELRAWADAGDWFAADRLAGLLAGQGHVEEAIQILRGWADADTGPAAERLAELLAGQGHVEELRARANAGDGFAGVRLAELLAGQGRVEEAIQMLRARADAGDWYAAKRLADHDGQLLPAVPETTDRGTVEQDQEHETTTD